MFLSFVETRQPARNTTTTTTTTTTTIGLLNKLMGASQDINII